MVYVVFDIANQWAASRGGPIRKDKLFFFFDTEGLRVLVPSIAQMLIPSTQFEDATITNINNRFGTQSASHTFYKQVFNLYNSAPGVSTAAAGSFAPGDLGCAGVPISLGSGVPCVLHYFANLRVPSQDTLTAERVDWNLGRSDRIFFRLLRDASHTTLASPITPIFDKNSKQTWWQGQDGLEGTR